MTDDHSSATNVSKPPAYAEQLSSSSKRFVKDNKQQQYDNYCHGRVEFSDLCAFSFKKQLQWFKMLPFLPLLSVQTHLSFPNFLQVMFKCLKCQYHTKSGSLATTASHSNLSPVTKLLDFTSNWLKYVLLSWFDKGGCGKCGCVHLWQK